jgi:polyphosphate kinase
MYRNFFKRIEVCFPILDPKVKKKVIKEGLEVYLKDNLNAWIMASDGTYHPRSKRGKPFCAQEFLSETMNQSLSV